MLSLRRPRNQEPMQLTIHALDYQSRQAREVKGFTRSHSGVSVHRSARQGVRPAPVVPRRPPFA